MIKLSISQILEAFPDEAKTMVPRERKKLRRELGPYFAEAERIRKLFCAPFYKYFMLAVLDSRKPRNKFKHLVHLENMERIMSLPKNEQLNHADIEHARSVPIFGLRTWEGFKGRPEKFMARCCFHDDKSASLGVTGALFNCFSCGAKGDVLNFIMKLNGLSFPQAVNYLVKK